MPEELERRAGLSRRELLAAGGALGAAALMASYGVRRASAATSDARVVVVGAGLAGVTATYQLRKVGVNAHLYEARDRLGGRCWTSRGWVDGQIAEHGGEFIDTRHVHIRQLVRQLGLELDDLFAGRYGPYTPNLVGNTLLHHKTIKAEMKPVQPAVTAAARKIGLLTAGGKVNMAAISWPTATPAAIAMDQLSMAEWLEQHVPGLVSSRTGQWLDEAMCSWYGSNLDALSALNWMDYMIVPYPGGDERWHVRGGNDQIIHRAVGTLANGHVHHEKVLRSIRRRSGGTYELGFDGLSRPVIADLVILTLPFTTLRNVDFDGAGFSRHKRDAIRRLSMGQDSKVLIQYDTRPWNMHNWSSTMTSADPDFDTWESSVLEKGKSGLITVYAGGRTSQSLRGTSPHAVTTPQLRNAMLDRINEAVPGSTAHFNGRSWADLWSHDPWTLGSYASFSPGQYTQYWGGTSQAQGGVHFAGEATSTYSQGFLNGGVESGDRAAIEVMKKLRIPVPHSLSRLPYSL
jgi:monoamine oxidase